ncbi:fibulin-1-like [Physella acuta]|uniref:fibulin-1-like n=1 Tax=Physella acuta TaxID=109671 RepID=UPI0027DC4C16|nr:fibulin-1-like [Physella acuta]
MIDPCKLINKSCEYSCRNGSNGAECFCASGYKLKANNYSCEDIDECKEKICSQICINTNGSFSCSCYSGYTLNKNDLRSCDTCQDNTYGYNCSNTCQCKGRAVRCDNVKGCICQSNWKGETCETDVDECGIKPDVCPVDHKCKNTEGSYTCDCPVGYEDINGTCININECETRNICPQTCIDTPGSFICECRDGFLKLPNGTCKDIDECEIDKSGCEQKCINVPGSSNCDCYPGYRLKDDRKTCEKDDFDPCENFYLNCSQGCTVTNGKAQCFCAIGYMLSNNQFDCLVV